MKIPLAEPLSPRYIYVNPETNQVHLLVPLVQGQEISTDNTCKSTAALGEFKSAALNELNAYKSALEFDLQWLKDDDRPLKALKEARLLQINAYIIAIQAMQEKYSSAIAAMMQTSANLYSIQLRPHTQDPQSTVVNPVFNIERTNDATGTPKSALYKAMYEAYPNVMISTLDPKSELDAAVLRALQTPGVSFTSIQAEMTVQCQRLFGEPVDFTQMNNPVKPGPGFIPVTQTYIDTTMGFSPSTPATTQDYMDALWGICAPNINAALSTAPFYSVSNHQDNKTEKLSILTQFFLAHVNIYCKARGISDKNFGVILDASSDLSDELVAIVSSALIAGVPVEEGIYTFFNEHAQAFGLAQSLTETDMKAIQEKF